MLEIKVAAKLAARRKVSYYLGIDGGGTKTTCAAGDDRQVLATATAGPSNMVRVGEAKARESLHQAVRQACAAAGIDPREVAHTCVGGSGAARPELAAAVRRALTEILPVPITVVGDMEIALEAAFGAGPGVIVIAGTGSIAFGRNEQGRTVRAGGWGFAISDEGSAHWIGRAAVSALLRAADMTGRASDGGVTGENSRLEDAIFKAWGVTSLADLARAANSIPPPDFAALFPPVAAGDDELAQQVLTQAGQELARLAVVVIHRLFGSPGAAFPEVSVPVAAIKVAMTGGVFRHAPLVRQVFYSELRRLDGRAEVQPQIVEPVEGALRFARRMAAQKTG